VTVRVAITKMSGAGNDFVVLDEGESERLGSGLAAWVRRVCARGHSIGADGVLVVRFVGRDRVGVRFYNPDGGEAFCGNGSRCAARFAAAIGMVTGPEMVLETLVGAVPARVDDTRVRLALPPPVDLGEHRIEAGDLVLSGRRVLAGVPHYVVFVSDPEGSPLHVWGPALRRHPDFGADGTNVDLASDAATGVVRVRTWERGVEGETLACGTGAVAVALAVRLRDGRESVTIRPRSGRELRVELAGLPGSPTSAILEGDARIVVRGEWWDEA